MEKIKVSLRKETHAMGVGIDQNTQQIGVNISGGVPTSIVHDNTLTGQGSRTNPLGISQEVLEEIKRGGNTFIFEFDASQTVWVINHNLNKKPSVTVVDSADTVMVCAVSYNDENTLTIELNAAFKGAAYLN